MDWIEVSLQGIDGEGVEAVWELMNRYGHGGAVIEDVRATPDSIDFVVHPLVVKAYLPADEEGHATLQKLREGLWHLSMLYPLPEPAVRQLAQQDWSEAWKQHYHRTKVGQTLVIVPAWEESAPAMPDEVIIRLDPGMAFGTGTHPSTQLCLELLEAYLRPGARVYDVGTGSGILAIAALKLGATTVQAVDIDRVAVQALNENAALNDIPPNTIQMREGSITEYPGPFDLILMNILAEVIADLLPEAAARLAPGGTIVMAGIIEPREHLVLDALAQVGLSVVARRDMKDWVGLAAQHPQP